MYHHIMVPLDGSELAECALPHANAIASLLKEGDKISLVRVVSPLRLYEGAEASLPPEERRRLTDESVTVAREYLDRAAAKLNLPGIKMEKVVLVGPINETLNKFAQDNGVGLVIITTHGRSGISRLFAGSTAESLIHTSKTPMLVVRPPGCLPPAPQTNRS